VKLRQITNRLVLPAVLGGLVCAGQSAGAQQKYVFVPGSRQAVRADSPQAQAQQQGYYRTSGGMSAQPGTQQYAIQQTPLESRQTSAGNARQYGSRQAPANWRQAGVSNQAGVSRQSGTVSPGKSAVGSTRDYVDYVKVDGGTRPFWVHLPSNHNKSRATPVVMVFPGLQMSGESMIGVTGLSGTANRNDFIAVYCESLGGEWEDGMKNQRHNDVGYVDAVLQRLAQTTNIDTHRVYAVGLSNGGYFVQLLAASRPEKIAAVAVVASTGMEAAVTRSHGEKPIPIVFFIGTQDPLINWGDGKAKKLGAYAKKLGMDEIDPSFLSLVRYGGWFSVPDVINFWTTHNRCQGSPRSTYMPDLDPRDGMRVKKDVWGNRGSEVILYSIEGGGHTWPGCIFLAGKRQSSCCQDINTGEEIWQFFRGQSR
jgi:polyhydroxybutyrate depolymerase